MRDRCSRPERSPDCPPTAPLPVQERMKKENRPAYRRARQLAARLLLSLSERLVLLAAKLVEMRPEVRNALGLVSRPIFRPSKFPKLFRR